MQIWKWKLDVTEKQTIYLPLGAKILDVQMQNESVSLWALCNETETCKCPRYIAIYGTGHTLRDNNDNNDEYIATFQMSGGALVFHVFEEH